jgi:peptide/nickel transport system permease protein
MSDAIALSRARTSWFLGKRPTLPPLPILLSMAVVAFVAVLALLGHLVAPRDPGYQNLAQAFSHPTSQFWLGTDYLGRDVFSRTVAGARTAIVGPILIALGSLAIGGPLGLWAGYRGGWIDAFVMRCADFMFALPALMVAVVLVGIFGGGYTMSVALLVVFFSPEDIRIVRGATLEQRGLPYVEAGRTLGLSSSRIMFRHILPNILPLIVANSFLRFAFALVSLSALSYLGLGVGPGDADWGRMLSDSRTHIFDTPLAALAPGGMIVLTSASMNLIGDWLYEQFASRGRAR